jgi:biotin carboxyl carrier protein
MKMETTLAAGIGGTVSKVAVRPGQLVDAGQVLVEVA